MPELIQSIEEVAGQMDAIRNTTAPVVFDVVPKGQVDHILYSFGMATKGAS